MTVYLALVKQQLRITHDDEDTLLENYMDASAAWLERYTGLLLEEGTVTDAFTEFGDYLELSRGPFVALTSIAYTDGAGDPQTVADARVRDGRIYAPVAGWPTIGDYTTITVTYTAGFDVYTLPPELEQAQLLLIGHWYQNREAVAKGSFAEVPLAVEALAGPFRVPTLR